MAGVKKATHEEFAAHLAASVPPENIILEIAYGSGDEKRVVEFQFKRSTLVFSHYVKTAYGPGGNAIQAAAQFLVDSAAKADQKIIAAFVETYPVEAILAASALSETYGGGNIETAIKNGSKPAES
jgi:hypothetical protein